MTARADETSTTTARGRGLIGAVADRPAPLAGITIVLVLVGMTLAGLLGTVDWVVAIGTGGTAVGTLGLAYFTFALAYRTTQVVASSQRLETTATAELTAGRQQAEAAITMAREAEKSRIDALAPIPDLIVTWQHVAQRAITAPANSPWSVLGQETIDRISGSLFKAQLAIRIRNIGRTPGFISYRHTDVIVTPWGVVQRVGPGEEPQFVADVSVPSDLDALTSPRSLAVELIVEGAMTRGTVDTLRWEGDLTLLRNYGSGLQPHADPLQMTDYSVTRHYPWEPGEHIFGQVDSTVA